MSKSDFDRGLDDNEGRVMGFQTYNDFVKHQENHINSLSSNQLEMMEFLKNLIPNSIMMDKRDMTTFDTDGFFFNSKNQVVFFHER